MFLLMLKLCKTWLWYVIFEVSGDAISNPVDYLILCNIIIFLIKQTMCITNTEKQLTLCDCELYGKSNFDSRYNGNLFYQL